MSDKVLIERLEELAATKCAGIWSVERAGSEPRLWIEAESGDHAGVCDFYHMEVGESFVTKRNAENNAALIVELVNNLPTLISALRENEKRGEALEPFARAEIMPRGPAEDNGEVEVTIRFRVEDATRAEEIEGHFRNARNALKGETDNG